MIIFSSPPKRKLDTEIFIDDVDFLVEQNFPHDEKQHPIFPLFGERAYGCWNNSWVPTENWRELPEVLKWKYVALCERYWRCVYEYYNDKTYYEQYKEELKELSKKYPMLLDTLKHLEQLEKEAKNE